MKQRSYRSTQVFLASGLIAMLSFWGPRAEARIPGAPNFLEPGSTSNPGVLPPQSNAFGKSYGEWSAEFWKWLFSLPSTQHPLFDNADCSEGQSGKVWFLGGTFTVTPVDPDDPSVVIGLADRDCSVPQGKALFFPIVNGACDTFEIPDATEEELRTCANELADHFQNMEVTIDGEPVQILNRYRVESPFFTYGPLPENNVLQDSTGNPPEGSTFDAVGDGFYLMLAPLSRGEHELHFKGEAEFTEAVDGFDFLFQLDITYHISVGR